MKNSWRLLAMPLLCYAPGASAKGMAWGIFQSFAGALALVALQFLLFGVVLVACVNYAIRKKRTWMLWAVAGFLTIGPIISRATIDTAFQRTCTAAGAGITVHAHQRRPAGSINLVSRRYPDFYDGYLDIHREYFDQRREFAHVSWDDHPLSGFELRQDIQRKSQGMFFALDESRMTVSELPGGEVLAEQAILSLKLKPAFALSPLGFYLPWTKYCGLGPEPPILRGQPDWSLQALALAKLVLDPVPRE